MPTLAPPRPLVEGASAWTGGDLRGREDQWMYHLSAAEIAEIQAATAAVRDRGLPLAEIRRSDFPLPQFGPVLDRIRDEILNGRGFVLIRGLPVEGRPTCTIRAPLRARLKSADGKQAILEPIVDKGSGEITWP